MKVCPTCGTPIFYNPAPAALVPNEDSVSAPLPAPTPSPYSQSAVPVPEQSPAQPPPTFYPAMQSSPVPPYGAAQYQQHPSPLLPPQKRGLSKGLTILLAVFVLLIIIGSGIIYYFAVSYPAHIHADAIATEQAVVAKNAAGTAVVIHNEKATATAQAQATLTAQQTMYAQATSGPLVLNDSLAQNSASLWDSYDSAANGGCVFANGAYHAKVVQQHYFQSCYAHASTFSNFTFQVQMTIVSGDAGGIIFRANAQAGKLYLLQFGTDKSYQLILYESSSGSSTQTLLAGYSDAINGLNQPNLLTLIARGNHFSIFVNNQYVDSTTDNTYASGQIGLLAYYKTAPTDVAFNNAKVWKL
jgi:hypothetical protein